MKSPLIKRFFIIALALIFHEFRDLILPSLSSFPSLPRPSSPLTRCRRSVCRDRRPAVASDLGPLPGSIPSVVHSGGGGRRRSTRTGVVAHIDQRLRYRGFSGSQGHKVAPQNGSGEEILRKSCLHRKYYQPQSDMNESVTLCS